MNDAHDRQAGSPDKRRDQPGWAAMLAFIAAFGISTALVAGFLGRFHPAFDTIAHFRAHLAVMLVAVTLPLAVTSFRWQGIVGATLGAAAFATVLQSIGFFSGRQTPVDPAAPVYRLLQINLRYDNATPEKVLSLIGRTRPDVVALDEVSTMWSGKLALLAGTYPYRLQCDMSGHAGGVAILSLRPFWKGLPGRCIDGGTYGVASVDFGGQPVGIGALHLHRPWPSPQKLQIDDLTPVIAALPATSLLAGDLNATPWSAAVRQVAGAGGMTLAGPGRATWLYRRLPDMLRFAGLPIDSIFIKGGVGIVSVRTLEPVGSDHLPVLAEFTLTAKPEAVEPDSSLVLDRNQPVKRLSAG